MINRVLATICVFLAIQSFLVDVAAATASNSVSDRTEMWLDLYTGEPVEFEEVVKDLAVADLIFLGERHTLSRHHQRQLEIVKALADNDRPMILGLEMMERHYQPELDRYCLGEITFEELAETTDWEDNWSNYRDYRAVVGARTFCMALQCSRGLKGWKATVSASAKGYQGYSS